MKEKALLIISIFKIPLKFHLKHADRYSDDSININSIQIESHIDYISENGSITSKASRKDTKIANVWLTKNFQSASDKYFYHFTDYPLSFQNAKITDILASKIPDIIGISDKKSLNPLEMKSDEGGKLAFIISSNQNAVENPKTADKIGNFILDPDIESLYFEVSNVSFNIIKILLKLSLPVKIYMNYSELQKTPFLLVFFLHLPIILTSIIIVILVLSFESGISKDLIQDEISKLPLQKFSEYLEFTECPICLDTFQINEEVRVLSCKHCFHKNCIDSWLKSMLKCPICRNSVTRLADSQNYEFYQSINNFP